MSDVDKLKKANEHINELVHRYVNAKFEHCNGHCLRVLLGMDRICDNSSICDCYQCNKITKTQFENKILEYYIVK